MWIKDYLPSVILVICIIFALFILYKILRSPTPLWNAVKSSLAGIVILFALSLISDYTGVYIPLSLMNIGISSLAGIPGVCMLIILNIIFM